MEIRDTPLFAQSSDAWTGDTAEGGAALRRGDPRWVKNYVPVRALAAARDRGSAALGEYRYVDAVAAYTDALALTSAHTAKEASAIAAENWWFPADPRRVEAAALYRKRAEACAGAERWADALRDALVATQLAPNAAPALELFASVAGRVAALPEGPAAAAELCHALVADVHTMLAEDVYGAGEAGQSVAEAARARHAEAAGSLRASSLQVALAIEAALSDVAATAPPPHALLLDHVVRLTAFRLGCRGESAYSWRPKHLAEHFRDDRAVEAWLRWRLRRRCGASLKPESDAARPAEQSAAAQSGGDESLVTWVRRGAIASVATAVLAIMLWWAPPAEIFWQSE